MQHSEIPTYPTQKEITARNEEMKMIIDEIENNYLTTDTTIVTGDLNLDDIEYKNSIWCEKFDKGDLYYDGQYTWGGDAFSAGKIANKIISSPSNLDHTMLYKKSENTHISSCLIDTEYDGTVFNIDALSDHKGILSKIYLV